MASFLLFISKRTEVRAELKKVDGWAFLKSTFINV